MHSCDAGGRERKMSDLLNTIKGRKSVRSFDGKKLTAEERRKLEEYAKKIRNPFDIPVRIVFLDAKERGLSSPVLTGETLYAAGIVEKKPYADVAFGYSFEQFVLYAWSLGIGTTWIGGTMKRELFENAASLGKNEMMPCITPLGHPAAKRSLKETLMRKGISADSRMPAEKLFFENSFDTPLSSRAQAELGDLIEMVRWSPSAVNKQPWRIVRKEGRFHFYEKKDKGFVKEATGDLQKIDVGIALSHFVMGLEETGKKAFTVVEDPGIKVPDGVEYVASVCTE